jgi:hypothetical protein
MSESRVLHYRPNAYGAGSEVEGPATMTPCCCVSRFGDNPKCLKHGDSGLKHNCERPSARRKQGA